MAVLSKENDYYVGMGGVAQRILYFVVLHTICMREPTPNGILG